MFTCSQYTTNLLQKHKQSLVNQLENSSVTATALDLLQWLMGPDAGGPSSVRMGVCKAIQDALTELHTTEKTVENTDQLMVSFVQLCGWCFMVVVPLIADNSC